MACIHYKFKNSLDFDSITFDGLHISVRDLKESIMHRKKLNDTDMDLLIINALNAKGTYDHGDTGSIIIQTCHFICCLTFYILIKRISWGGKNTNITGTTNL